MENELFTVQVDVLFNILNNCGRKKTLRNNFADLEY